MSAPAPTAPSERNLALDVLHGAALLGVVMVDLPMFFRPLWGELNPAWAAASAGAEAWARAAVVVFFQGKSLTMFAVLFGASFAILRGNFGGRAEDFRVHYARRMTALALLGIAQGVFLWHIGILLLLASLGAACLIASHLDAPLRRRLAAALIAAGFLGTAALLALNPGVAAGGSPSYLYHVGYLAGFEDGVYSHGAWRQVLGLRAANFLFFFPAAFHLVGARLLGAMLVGAELQDAGLFRDSPESRRFWGRCVRVGACLGFPVQALTAWTLFVDRPSAAVLVLRWGTLYAGSAALAAAYMGAGCLWAWGAGEGSRARGALARAGRMCLSNYLGFIAAGSLLAYPYGLGLYGKVSEPAAAALGAALYAAMLAGSALWLARFRFGPFEWLLRAAAYRNAPAMSR